MSMKQGPGTVSPKHFRLSKLYVRGCRTGIALERVFRRVTMERRGGVGGEHRRKKQDEKGIRWPRFRGGTAGAVSVPTWYLYLAG